MIRGIAVYAGMGECIDDIEAYIESAADKGLNGLFTSLQLRGNDNDRILEDFPKITALAAQYHMLVDADIGTRTFKVMGIDNKCDMKAIKELGIDIVRLDYGYNIGEIAWLSRNTDGIVIEINASTFGRNPGDLDALADAGASFDNIWSCHNFYPKAHTGLTPEFVSASNRRMGNYGIRTGAFIASRYHHRAGGDGLPTVERQRFIDPAAAAAELCLLETDNIYFGDDFAHRDELAAIASAGASPLALTVEPLPGGEWIIRWLCGLERLWGNPHSDWKSAIRKAREIDPFPESVEPFNTIARKKGDITIDNGLYGRYGGEVNIVKEDLPADGRVNVIGRIREEERFLIDYIDMETQYRFSI